MHARGISGAAVLALVLSGSLGETALGGDPELNELWVGGFFTNEVIRIDWKTGEIIGTFIPSGYGGLREPHDFSFGPDGNFYVASRVNSTVRRYSGRTGAFIDVFVDSTNDLDRAHSTFWNPVTGNLLVASELTDLVNEYDTDGNYLGRFVEPGEAGLDRPEFITEGPDGFLYLSAGPSNRVLKLDPASGGVVEVFLDQPGGLDWAHGLTFGPNGNLYVASSQNNRVIEYDGRDGTYVRNLVTSGSGGLDFPFGIAFGPDGNLYVASAYTNEILKYDGVTGESLGVLASVVPAGMDGPAAIRFVTGPRCDTDLGGPDDCDSNGVHDECDLGDGAGDCNRNGVIDACEIASGASADCNENGTPDACEVTATFEASSGPLLPIGSGEPQSFSFAAEPATGDATLHFTASANLGLPFEQIGVSLGDTGLGMIFQTDGSECPEVPDETTVVVDATTYNAAIDGGMVTVTMTPNNGVDPRACDGTSFITVAVSAPREPANDADGNGVPDDCSACPTDLDGNGSTGFADLNVLLQGWGPCGDPCSTDLDDDGSTGFSDLMILLSRWGPC